MYGRVYVLDAGYQFSGTMSWQRASWLAYTNQVEVLVSSNIKLRHDFFMPKIIRVFKTIRSYYRNGIPWNRENLMIRDSFMCQYCGDTPKHSNLTIDHVIPKSRGGKNSWANTVVACKKCNSKKDDRTPAEAEMHFYVRNFKPIQPTIMEFFLQKIKFEGLDKMFDDLGIY